MKRFDKKWLIILIFIMANIDAKMYTIGSGNMCEFSQLQAAINDAISNNDTDNELRLVNDGSFDDASYLFNLNVIKNIKIQGGYKNCEAATNNNITEKTVINAANNQSSLPIFSITSQLASDNVLGRPQVRLADLIFEKSQADFGGAIYIENVKTEIVNSQFVDNQAINGGAIFCKADLFFNILILQNSEFSNNQAINDGGALYLSGNESGNTGYGCSTYMSDHLTPTDKVVFNANTAENFGGAIFVGENLGDTIFGGDIFTGNSANKGGVIFINSGISSFSGIFSNNSASDKGGVVYISKPQGQSSNTDFHDSTFINNSAGMTGGVFYSEQPNLHVYHSIIENNHASIASVAHTNGLFYLHKSMVLNQSQSETLFFGNSPNGLNSRIEILNSEIMNNSLIDSLIDSPRGSIKLVTSYVVDNQVNNNLIEKGESVLTNHRNIDLFDFLTIAGNTIGGHVFAFNNNVFEIKNNIFWQPKNTLFNASNSKGSYNCNLVSSERNALNGTHNISTNPQFVGGTDFDYHIKINSPAIDYCETGHQFDFSTKDNDNDFGMHDIDFISNEFGPVDIGADQVDASNVLFTNGFE